MTAAARALAVATLLLSACGGAVPTFLRATASLAVATSGGYRALRAYDADKQAGIQKRAKAGDPSGAEAELNDYAPKKAVALKVLDAASVGAEGAYAAVPVVGQALDAKKRAELAAWVPVLVKLGVDVVQALSVFGIKVPGLGGGP